MKQMKQIIFTCLLFIGVLAMNVQSSLPKWEQFNNIEKTTNGYRTTGPDPFMVSAPFDVATSPEQSCLMVDICASKPLSTHFYWWAENEHLDLTRLTVFGVPQCDKSSTNVIDLGAKGTYKGAKCMRIGFPGDKGGTDFQIKCIEYITPSKVPKSFQKKMIDFRCFTSKLHYQPGESIEYRATLQARNYPDRQSSKILELFLEDEKSNVIAQAVQHYGIHPLQQIKDLFGVFETPKTKPGKYRLRTISTDQRSGLTLESTHDFGVQSKDAPFICETPFKFVKDFSFIKDHNGLWHVFSITGELILGHDWTPDGNERTFSHATSPDLRNWTWHKPVLSIKNDKYSDGNGYYQDRNIWAPHVIRHNNKYYMFYTSINKNVSQSVSLATSKDLFHWEEFPGNPVSTPEKSDWALWGRNQWGDYRDPVVLATKDENGKDKFYMYVTAQALEGEKKGVVSVSESDDLINWSVPKIAVRGNVISESPQVWEKNGTFFMATSAVGSDTYTSKYPDKDWKKTPFARPKITDFEKYVGTSGLYGEEVVKLNDGSLILAMMTFRHWGNSLYFFKIETDKNGYPIGHKSPFNLKN